MVRRDVAGARLARAVAWLDDASRILDQPVDEFVAAVKDRDLALFYLCLSSQECIDLPAHWVADAGWGAPDDAGPTFDVLAARYCIDHDLADRLRLAAGTRARRPLYGMYWPPLTSTTCPVT